jgi:HSP20 family protein
MPKIITKSNPMDNTNENEIKEKFPLTEEEGQLTVDVFQTDTEFVIKSAIAGVNPEDIDIDVKEDTVTIKGTRKKDEYIKEEDYLYQECFWGPFSRIIILPESVDAAHAKATLKNGILTIRLPKLEKTQEKRLSVSEE